MTQEPHQLAEEGKRAFAKGRYKDAIRAFEEAARGFTLGRDGLNAAEMQNNLSVALLKDNQPQQALDAAAGTDKTFEMAKDAKRQAMALGNQAAAFEALKRFDEALTMYEQAASLFAGIGEGDLQSFTLKAIAAIRIKQGKISEAGMDMLGSLGVVKKPSLLQRFMKFLLRFKP
jgi:tetratricopeptide (TPR) repeat protein